MPSAQSESTNVQSYTTVPYATVGFKAHPMTPLFENVSIWPNEV